MPVPKDKAIITDSTKGYALLAIHTKLGVWGKTDPVKRALYKIYGVDSLTKVDTQDLLDVVSNMQNKTEFIKFLKMKGGGTNDSTK
jgi:hypothetical protein